MLIIKTRLELPRCEALLLFHINLMCQSCLDPVCSCRDIIKESIEVSCRDPSLFCVCVQSAACINDVFVFFYTTVSDFCFSFVFE